MRELEVEEGRLGLLELARDRQHVVREPRGLGEGDVDHDDQLERRDRLAHARAVGERVRGIAALDEQRAEALRMVGQDLVGDHVAGREPADDARARHGRAPLGRRRGRSRSPAARRRSAGRRRPACRSSRSSSTSSLCRYETSVECRFICTPRSSKMATLEAPAMRRAVAARPAPPARRTCAQYSATVRRSKCGSTSARPSACAASQSPRRSSSCTITAIERREQEGVGAGLHLQVDVGDLRGLGAARVDHDQRALRVVRDLAQRHARARDAVREPRVLAEEERHLAVLEVAARVAAEHLVRRPRTRPSSPARARSTGSASRARRAWCARRRPAGDCPARRRRNRRSIRRRSVSRTAAKRAATSRIAVSQSISSNVPSARRRSGFVSRCGPFW